MTQSTAKPAAKATPKPAPPVKSAAPAESKSVESKPVESVPAKRAKKPTADVDFGALSFSAAPAPKRAPGAGRKTTWEPHPVLLAAIDESWNGREVATERTDRESGRKVFTYVGKGQATTVPTDAATTVITAIRKVADFRGLGVAVDQDDNPNGTTTIRFAAKTRKQSRKTA